MDTELIELITHAQKGNMEAFSSLIMNFEQDLYRIASIRLKSVDDIDDAIEHGYIDKPNMEYIDSNGTELKINQVLMDDYNLSLEMSIKLSEKVNTESIDEISFQDMIITDENNNILYCEDSALFLKNKIYLYFVLRKKVI